MRYIDRCLRNKLIAALDASPVVFLNGPRQAGKSTLVQHLAQREFPAEYVTFDSAIQMAAASSAPEAYVRERQGPLIIDEVQLVPEIFRALKVVVDQMRQESDVLKAQFLLTGSANIMALPQLSDPLVGRMATLTLYPLCGAEVISGKGDFVRRLFERQFFADSGQYSLIDIMHAATFPEISGVPAPERANWLDGYLTTILQRDVRALAEIEKLSVLPNLMRILAARSGALINDANVARDAGLNHMTTRNYKTLLKMLFLTFEVAPWYRNIGKRLTKAAKGYLLDTSLLCHLLQYELHDLQKNRPDVFGHVLENFVATEILKLLANDEHRVSLHHFRTSDNKEVDFVIEKPNGQLVGIEVKKRDDVGVSDFKGLKALQTFVGSDFVCGIVLYGGKEVVPFGDNLWAVPLANLWA